MRVLARSAERPPASHPHRWPRSPPRNASPSARAGLSRSPRARLADHLRGCRARTPARGRARHGAARGCARRGSAGQAERASAADALRARPPCRHRPRRSRAARRERGGVRGMHPMPVRARLHAAPRVRAQSSRMRRRRWPSSVAPSSARAANVVRSETSGRAPRERHQIGGADGCGAARATCRTAPTTRSQGRSPQVPARATRGAEAPPPSPPRAQKMSAFLCGQARCRSGTRAKCNTRVSGRNETRDTSNTMRYSISVGWWFLNRHLCGSADGAS